MNIGDGSTNMASLDTAMSLDDVASLLVENEEEVQSTDQESPNVTESEKDDGETGKDEGEGAEEQEGEQDADLTWGSVLGIDDSQIVLDEEQNLKGINVKVDGQVSTVGVKELVAGYQMAKHNTQTSQALAAEKKEFESFKSQALQQYEQQLTTAAKLNDLLEQSYLQDFNNIDWVKLRAERPDEYAATVTDFNLRKQKLEATAHGIASEKAQLEKAQQEEFQARRNEYLQEQYQNLVKNNPEWVDHTKLMNSMNELGSFATATYGITPEEFSMIADARYIEILKDAMTLRKGKQILKNGAPRIPTVLTSKGKAQTGQTLSKSQKLANLAKKAAPGASRDIQVEAIAALLGE